MGDFDEADLQKYYALAQIKDDETVTIAGISRQIGRKIQASTNTAPPPGFNIGTAEDPSITSGRTLEAAKYEDASLLGGAYLALDPAGDDISNHRLQGLFSRCWCIYAWGCIYWRFNHNSSH